MGWRDPADTTKYKSGEGCDARSESDRSWLSLGPSAALPPRHSGPASEQHNHQLYLLWKNQLKAAQKRKKKERN